VVLHFGHVLYSTSKSACCGLIATPSLMLTLSMWPPPSRSGVIGSLQRGHDNESGIRRMYQPGNPTEASALAISAGEASRVPGGLSGRVGPRRVSAADVDASALVKLFNAERETEAFLAALADWPLQAANELFR
jgi:hypothetical protein